jgi:SAM-dependent methyltransferase
MAESFGTDADRYDRARPRYPQALIERIIAQSPGTGVLDVGSGTGIVGRQLQDGGCRVLGIEPDARMAAVGRRFGLAAEEARIESWDPAGRMFDAVVAGQSWHWVNAAEGAAKAAQVLWPGGLFVAFWNGGQPPADLAETFAAITRTIVPDLPGSGRRIDVVDAYTQMSDAAAAGLQETRGFGESERWRYDWDFTYSKEAWLDQLPTLGVYTQLAPGKLAELLTAVGDAIDAAGGSLTVHFSTMAVAAHRLA